MSKHTAETKRILSQKRKEYLAANPDKHPWRCSTKFVSIPCENLKDILRNKAISFIAEYQPSIGDKNYSIDIAFPDKLIGIEVNGNQHYERDGTLKPYYKEREGIIEGAGWKLYQIHYSCCFKEEMILPVIEEILTSEIKKSFNYLEYKPKTREDKFCSTCRRKIGEINTSGLCRKCCSRTPKVETRKVKRPEKEQLEKMVWEKPTLTLAKELGVSDVAIAKWCKSYGIQKPPRGHWEKIYHKKSP